MPSEPSSTSAEQNAAAGSRELFKHTRNYVSASVFANIAVAVSFPLLTYLLTPEDYGVLSIFSTLVQLLTVALLLNINSGVSRYYLEKLDDFDRALGSNLLFLAAANAVLFVPLLLFSGPLARFFAIEREVLVYAAIAALLSVLPELYLTYISSAQESRRFALLSVLRTVTQLVLMIGIILLLEDKKYLGKVYSEFAVLAGFSLFALIALRRLARFEFDARYVKYTLRFSLPLIPHTLARHILGYFDRIQINQITNASDTGIYSFAYDIGMAMSLIVVAASRAWRPIFIEEYAAGEFEKLDHMVKNYANQIYLAAAAITLFATDIVVLFVDERFHAALPLVPVVVLGYVFVFLYTLFFQYASFRKRTELISVSTLIAGVANIGLNYLFIPIYGYVAAAYTTLACFALLFALHYGNARFVLKERLIGLSNLLPGFSVVVAITVAVLYFDAHIASYSLFLLVRLALMAGAAYLFYWRPRRLQRRHA